MKSRHALMLPVVLGAIGLGYAERAYGVVLAADNFNRADSNVLGNTPVGGYAWTEKEVTGPDQVSVSGNRLNITGRAHGDDLAAELGGLSLKDLDISVDFTPLATSGTNYLGGVAYRLPGLGTGLFNVAGFSVTISKDAWGGPLSAGHLELGGFGSYLGGYTVPGGFTVGTNYTLRVVAEGSNHKVYLDGVEVINYTDPNLAHDVAGIVGVGTGYGDYSFDNFSVSDLNPIPEPTTGLLFGFAGSALLVRRRTN